LGVTGDLMKNVSFGVTGYAVSTLGLENNLVSNTWAGSRNGVEDNAWLGELWIAATAGNTTGKVGRMELDTPLVFSEKWSTVPNTFNAVVLMNTDLPDTTLVGAWVGQGNGLNTGGTANDNPEGWDYMGKDFGTFANSGAYAAGVVNNSFKPLTAQAWYYNVSDIADAYWLQADWDCQLIEGVKVGVQFAEMDPKDSFAAVETKDSSAYAVKLAYEGIKDLTLAAAYSSADKDNGALSIANVATDNNGYYLPAGKFSAQSKLYTEAWWNFGYVGTAGTDALMLSAAYDAGFAQLFAQLTDINKETTVTGKTNVTEVTLTATKSFGPSDATLAYISTDADDQNQESGSAKRYDTVQAYLTLNF